MFPASERFFEALRQSHKVATRVDLYSGNRLLKYDIPFSEGNVSVSSGTGVHRKLELTVSDPSLWELLEPVGAELRAYRGIEYPDKGLEWVPLGVFSLEQQAAQIKRTGEITISSAPDRYSSVQRARFELPRISRPELTAVQSIAALVQEAVACQVDTSGVTTVNPNHAIPTTLQVWDRDRDAAISDLATAAGVEAFFGPQGELVIRDVPVLGWAKWRVNAGKNGVLLSANATRDRTRVYNVVVVVSGKTDGTPPFQPQIVEDLDPNSPTNVKSPFGRVPYFLTSNTLTGAVSARCAGKAVLSRTRGRYIDMSVDAIVNPCLEAGDSISVTTYDGTTHAYVVDSFDVPLTAEGRQTITLRTLSTVSDENSSSTSAASVPEGLEVT